LIDDEEECDEDNDNDEDDDEDDATFSHKSKQFAKQVVHSFWLENY